LATAGVPDIVCDTAERSLHVRGSGEMSNEEMLDLLHFLDLRPILLRKQIPGFVLIFDTRDEQALAILALDMFTRGG
jgi:hypothetical protein